MIISETRSKDALRAERWRQRNPERRKAYSKLWNAKNAEKVRAASRRALLRKKYNITPEEWDRLLAEQGGKCAACGDPNPKKYHTDHCHKNGHVRGILCSPCNLAVGHLRDDPEIARAVASYLERTNAA